MAHNTVALLKPIKAGTLKVAAVRLELLNALRREGRAVVKEHKATVETWHNEKPDFEFLIGLSGGNATLVVGPTGNEKGVKKWDWLNFGTRIRWALMSRDWRSKTTPRYIGSGPGAGRVILVGKRAFLRRNIAPRPGIEARKWTDDIANKRKHPFRDTIIDALQRGREKATQHE